MKHFFIFICLFLQACTFDNNGNIAQKPLAYRFGDRVFVQDGFYKGCKGRVIAFRYGFSEIEPSYRVAAKCTTYDGKFSYEKEMEFEARELIEDVSQ